MRRTITTLICFEYVLTRIVHERSSRLSSSIDYGRRALGQLCRRWLRQQDCACPILTDCASRTQDDERRQQADGGERSHFGSLLIGWEIIRLAIIKPYNK